MGAQYCPGCGYQLRRTPAVLATDSFERQLYRQTRYAFYHRFVERVERRSAETSLYGVIRLLARRPIEIDLAAALSDLAEVLHEAARPYVASLRTREILVELSGFLAGATGEVQRQLDALDVVSRAAAAELIDHPLSRHRKPVATSAVPSVQRIWPGISACIGPAVEPSQIAGKLAAECEILLHQLNTAFLDFVTAYDRLWLPIFSFVERYMAEKCRLLWRRHATFELDFRRYATLVIDAKKKAGEQRLDEALEVTRLARAAEPDEYLAPLLEGHILYHLGRPAEALTAFEQAATLQLPYVSLNAEKYYWGGRCLIDEGRYQEAIRTFEMLVALPKAQVEARYFVEGEFLLAHAYLLTHDLESFSRSLQGALHDGYTEVSQLLTDHRLDDHRGHQAFRSVVRSPPFLQALSRQAGVLAFGSTYLSRSAAPFKQTAAKGSWIELADDEEVVFFYDASRTGSGRRGLCLTDRRLLWKGAGHSQALPLENLQSLQMGEAELGLNGNLVISDQAFDRLDALYQLLLLVQKVFQN